VEFENKFVPGAANPGAPMSEFSGTIDWGDGSPATTFRLDPGATSFQYPAQQYLRPGQYTITVTLTDALTSTSTTVSLPGTTDTISIPLTGLSVGTHTFTAAYSGDSNYKLTGGQTAYSTAGPYVVTVNAGSLAASATTLSGVPSSITYGTSFTATATVTGSNPAGSVQFILNGSVYATTALTSGSVGCH